MDDDGCCRATCKEYAQADRIYVASSYIRESFLERGLPRSADGRLFPLTPHPRFDSARAGGESRRVRHRLRRQPRRAQGRAAAGRRVPPTRLRRHAAGARRRLGNARHAALRRSVHARRTPASRSAPAIRSTHLRTASLCVHPAYEDGFGYAPAEALACGVPVIVSEDTGMKELIELAPRRPDPADRRSGRAHARRSRPPTALSCSAPDTGRRR